MNIIHINEPHIMKIVAQALKKGKVIVYPTETAYGLGADPRNKKALQKIYKIKGRDSSKMLPVLASSTSQVQHFFYMNNYERNYAKQHWPGAHTMVLRRKTTKDGLAIDYDTVAVRVSSFAFARGVSRRLGVPLISTSANISGTDSLYDVHKIIHQFKSRTFQPDIYIDAGVLPKRKPSRIVRFSGRDIEVLRP